MSAQLQLSPQLRAELVRQLGQLKQQNAILAQNLREQKSKAAIAQEELFLELLEVTDALEFLLNFMDEHPNFSDRFLQRLPKSLGSIQRKLLAVLERRQVSAIALEGDRPNFEFCRVVDREVRDDLEDQTITCVVRQGFRWEDKVLRPVEVITSKPS